MDASCVHFFDACKDGLLPRLRKEVQHTTFRQNHLTFIGKNV